VTRDPLPSVPAKRRATTLCLAVARYGDVVVRRPAHGVAAALAERFGHLFELYQGRRLGSDEQAGGQALRPGADLSQHETIRLRALPDSTPFIVAVARQVEIIK
jgi:hypothetical protein